MADLNHSIHKPRKFILYMASAKLCMHLKTSITILFFTFFTTVVIVWSFIFDIFTFKYLTTPIAYYFYYFLFHLIPKYTNLIFYPKVPLAFLHKSCQFLFLVAVIGFEPMAFRLSVEGSTKLSYTAIVNFSGYFIMTLIITTIILFQSISPLEKSTFNG